MVHMSDLSAPLPASSLSANSSWQVSYTNVPSHYAL